MNQIPTVLAGSKVMRKKRHPNHRLVKKHRSYTVEEIARLFGIHRNTVRSWITAGLCAIDNRRPMLVQGGDLIHFLQERRRKNKRSCGPGELYCFRCRAPKPPAAGMIEYRPITEAFGNLTAICPDCGCLLHRIIGFLKGGRFREQTAISSSQAVPHIREIVQPSANSDLR
jgi:helix-turn-helix protein